jgi:hypothetical protein
LRHQFGTLNLRHLEQQKTLKTSEVPNRQNCGIFVVESDDLFCAEVKQQI